jgi:hypothetical protein
MTRDSLDLRQIHSKFMRKALNHVVDFYVNTFLWVKDNLNGHVWIIQEIFSGFFIGVFKIVYKNKKEYIWDFLGKDSVY